MFDRYFPESEQVRAGDATSVADAIASACAERRPVYPVGGGTALGIGATVSEPGTILLLDQFNGLIDYPSRDLTVTVEAGMTMAELAGLLAAENQRLPIDVGCAKSATVGGVVAANLSGPRRYRFGTVRDYLLGFTAVNGTGETFSAGGRVVKNAAGYDLTRLMIGSLGTLGVMTQVTFMVRPQPEMSAFATISLPSLDAGDSLLETLGARSIEPTALELLVGDALPEVLTLETPAGLWIGFEGSRPDVQWMLEVVTEVCRERGLKAALRDVPDAVEPIWRELTEHGSVVAKDETGATLAVEVTVMPSKMIPLASRLRELEPKASIHCRAGNGVLAVRTACEPQQAGEKAAGIRQAAVEFGGRAVVTAYPAESQLDRETVWGQPGIEMRVMQRIKEQFDPQGILNPGRFSFAPSSVNIPT